MVALVAGVVLVLCLLTAAKEFHVATNCTGLSSSCHNLSYYLRDPSLYLTSDTVLTFLEGTHLLDEVVIVSGVTNLTLQGEGRIQDGYHWTVRESTVKIQCTMNSNSGFFFIESLVHIERLTFTNCGSSVDSENLRASFEPFLYGVYKRSYNFERYLHLQASLVFLHSSNVSLYEVSIQNCSGFCIFSLNTANINMSHVYIAHTNPTEFADMNCCSEESQDNTKCVGGNIILFYLHVTSAEKESDSYNLEIYDSIFSFGAGFYNYTQTEVTMSGITIVDISLRLLYVFMHSVIMFENTGGNLGALTTEAVIGFNNITSIGANRHICKGSHPNLSFKISVTNEVTFARLYASLLDKNETLTVLYVNNSKFLGNLATDSAGMNLDTSLNVPFLSTGSLYLITIANSVFSNNIAAFGSCIGIGGITPISVSTLSFNLINVTFDENYFDPTYLLYDAHELRNPYKGVPPSCLAFGNTANATFLNVTIANHDTLGIYAYNTHMNLYGNNEIRNNSGIQGGGLMLLGTSDFVLKSSVLRFIDNRAERGAAIFISSPLVSSASFPFCQYQVDVDNNMSSTDSLIYFSGNKASITGDIIYGGDVDDCLLFTDFGVIESSLLFNSLFDYEEDNINPNYAISSDATKVCFCFQGRTLCNVSQRILNPVYPGQTVVISVATVGETDGYTTGKIKIEHGNDSVVIVPNNVPRCFDMTLPIDELNVGSNVSLRLSIEDPFDGDDSFTLSLVIPIEYCPPGFGMGPQSASCECDAAIISLRTSVECSIEGEYISHQSDAWIGFSAIDSCVLVSDHCPFDYCLNDNITFNIYQPDPQCALNRSGVLCGECAEGLSLMLGSNKCGDCSDSTVALLLVFGLAGLALVILLIGLNLTVTVGTINGLIFYANIVKVNQPIFFPNGPIPFLSQFISWINLDFGIETCFYKGMTPSDKVWLQFVFPLYIWIIIGVIIIACHYSTKLSILVGPNAVPVLATLVLLSYVKLIRTYIIALKKSTVSCGLNYEKSVWAVDGNIAYFSQSHILLFVLSILVLITTVIPFTMFVILIPVLERYAGVCGKFWLSFLKPISDAYCGPFKDKFRFWAGLILLARLVIANTVPFLPQTGRLLLIIFVISFLLFFFGGTGGPYKCWYLNLLEVWFFAHLLCLAALALGDAAVIGTKLSVSLAFITFFAIITAHLFIRLREIKLFHRFSTNLSRTAFPKNPMVSVVSVDKVYPRFRESLLQDEPYD